jgi:hypothetical protein
MWLCDRCGRGGGIHVVGYHDGGRHMGEFHLCDPCFQWSLLNGYIDEPFLDPDDFDRRTGRK